MPRWYVLGGTAAHHGDERGAGRLRARKCPETVAADGHGYHALLEPATGNLVACSDCTVRRQCHRLDDSASRAPTSHWWHCHGGSSGGATLLLRRGAPGRRPPAREPEQARKVAKRRDGVGRPVRVGGGQPGDVLEAAHTREHKERRAEATRVAKEDVRVQPVPHHARAAAVKDRRRHRGSDAVEQAVRRLPCDDVWGTARPRFDRPDDHAAPGDNLIRVREAEVPVRRNKAARGSVTQVRARNCKLVVAHCGIKTRNLGRVEDDPSRRTVQGWEHKRRRLTTASTSGSRSLGLNVPK